LGLLPSPPAAAVPSWRAPVQVKVLPVTDRASDYADQVAAKLDKSGYRVEVDHRSEKLGYKIRQARNERVPYMLIVGDKDVENQTVSPRHRTDGDLGAMSYEAFEAILKEVVDTKAMK
ncbi:MAG: threonine--tRNA ligase, partial [Clostridiales bacterium]|nr:threonine--tRNA ligase [Clostridiales bacterium]